VRSASKKQRVIHGLRKCWTTGCVGCWLSVGTNHWQLIQQLLLLLLQQQCMA
jgi:hypothetical protein